MKQIKDLEKTIKSVLETGDILVIVPPFSRSCHGAMLEPHNLQAIASKNGYKTGILYLNILLAAIIGIDISESVSQAPRYSLLGERLFARSAYGLPPLGKSPNLCFDEENSIHSPHAPLTSNNKNTLNQAKSNDFDIDFYLELEKTCFDFIETVATILAKLPYRVISCIIGWDQTNCSAALFQQIKTHRPDIITLTGGMNCEGDMAAGIATLSENFDCILSGEIDSAFTIFLNALKSNEYPIPKVITGPPVTNLDDLPLPVYDSFFDQYQAFTAQPPKTSVIAYETSRGCWKGEKNRCAFCGLNSSERIHFRYKNPGKVSAELTQICKTYPPSIIFMTDHAMPPAYYHELLPHLQLPGEFSIRYELLADLQPDHLSLLKSASINRIQPGIEALSTNLLNLIHKGTKACYNIHLLRLALSMDIHVYWYLLWGIPGDTTADYIQTLELLPLLRHLQPPAQFSPVRFERFSRYLENPAHYKIKNLEPWAVYSMIYPTHADIEKLAYRFSGDFPSESIESPELTREIAAEIQTWQTSWRNVHLVMTTVNDDVVIFDSRKIHGKNESYLLNPGEAQPVMTFAKHTGSRMQQWAVEKKLGVVLDDYYVPLVTAKPSLLQQFLPREK